MKKIVLLAAALFLVILGVTSCTKENVAPRKATTLAVADKADLGQADGDKADLGQADGDKADLGQADGGVH